VGRSPLDQVRNCLQCTGGKGLIYAVEKQKKVFGWDTKARKTPTIGETATTLYPRCDRRVIEIQPLRPLLKCQFQ